MLLYKNLEKFIDIEYNGLIYTVINNTIYIIGYNQLTIPFDVTIPSSINSIIVTQITNSAFLNAQIKTIIIPFSVTSIGESAFKNTSILTQISIENTDTNPSKLVIINKDTFLDSGIKSITIPDTITSIGDSAFKNTKNFTEIIISDNSLLNSIGNNAFYASTLARLIIPQYVTNIGLSAFFNCSNLRLVIFKNNYPTIGVDAFTNIEANAYGYYYNDLNSWIGKTSINGLTLKGQTRPLQKVITPSNISNNTTTTNVSNDVNINSNASSNNIIIIIITSVIIISILLVLLKIFVI